MNKLPDVMDDSCIQNMSPGIGIAIAYSEFTLLGLLIQGSPGKLLEPWLFFTVPFITL